jgi:hypothetical protein
MNKEIMESQKKSAVDLTELAIGIVILGITVGIGAVVIHNMATSQITNVGTYSVLLEGVTPYPSGANLAVTWGKSVDYCQNGTTNVINSPNWTTSINPSNGVMTISNATSTFGSQAWKCNYTVYNVSDIRYNTPIQAEIGLAEYGNWFKILVIVGIAAAVLGLIFLAFGRGNTSGVEGGASY